MKQSTSHTNVPSFGGYLSSWRISIISNLIIYIHHIDLSIYIRRIKLNCFYPQT